MNADTRSKLTSGSGTHHGYIGLSSKNLRIGLFIHLHKYNSSSQSLPLIGVSFVFGGSNRYAFLTRVKFMSRPAVVLVVGIAAGVVGCVVGAGGAAGIVLAPLLPWSFPFVLFVVLAGRVCLSKLLFHL